MIDPELRDESVRSLERGLRVIRALGRAGGAHTLADVGRATGLSRATVRRILFTLEDLGYARRIDDRFLLTPRTLDLGYAYFAASGLSGLASPVLEALTVRLDEASSVAVLDGTEIVYVARVPARHVMAVTIGLGSRFPAYRTALGRALLSETPEDQIAALWTVSDHRNPTPRTVQTLDEFRSALAAARSLGYALVEEELDAGLRSIAVPIRDRDRTIVAAVNVSTHVSRTSVEVLRRRFLPELQRAAADIEAMVGSLASVPGARSVIVS